MKTLLKLTFLCSLFFACNHDPSTSEVDAYTDSAGIWVQDQVAQLTYSNGSILVVSPYQYDRLQGCTIKDYTFRPMLLNNSLNHYYPYQLGLGSYGNSVTFDLPGRSQASAVGINYGFSLTNPQNFNTGFHNQTNFIQRAAYLDCASSPYGRVVFKFRHSSLNYGFPRILPHDSSYLDSSYYRGLPSHLTSFPTMASGINPTLVYGSPVATPVYY